MSNTWSGAEGNVASDLLQRQVLFARRKALLKPARGSCMHLGEQWLTFGPVQIGMQLPRRSGSAYLSYYKSRSWHTRRSSSSSAQER
jgi:hypothetical protein